MDQSFMKERPLWGLVLSMSLPNMLSMLMNSLYTIADTFFVAKISEDAITALSLIFPIQNIVIAVSVGFAVGIGAAVSLFCGIGNRENADISASVGMVFCALHGILLTVGCLTLTPHFIALFTDSENIISLGRDYAHVLYSFALPYSLSIGYEKLFQSVGRMKVSMGVLISGCLTNIILDPIFISFAGIKGAAWATVAGQGLTLILYIIINRIRPMSIKLSFKSLKFKKSIVFKLFYVGIPATLNIALPSLLISALNKILAAYSEVYVLVLGIYYKLQTFFYLPSNGIIQGIRPLVGYNYGAGEQKRVKGIIKISLIMSSSIMLLGTVICTIFPEFLMKMFTDNPETIKAGVQAIPIIASGFVVSSISITACGVLEGLGRGLSSLTVALLRFIVLIIPAAYILSCIFGAGGVWHAFWITELLTAFVSAALCARAVKHGINESK